MPAAKDISGARIKVAALTGDSVDVRVLRPFPDTLSSMSAHECRDLFGCATRQ